MNTRDTVSDADIRWGCVEEWFRKVEFVARIDNFQIRRLG